MGVPTSQGCRKEQKPLSESCPPGSEETQEGLGVEAKLLKLLETQFVS